MVTVCILCSMRALADGAPEAPIFHESPEAHQQRCHPDLAAAQQEHLALETQLHQQLLAREAGRDRNGG